MNQPHRPQSCALRERIAQLGIDNWEGHKFIPYHHLTAILEATTVRDVIGESGIMIYRSDEAVKAVLNGGQRLFAILNALGKESLILNFKRVDSFLDKPLDSALPYEEPLLRGILEEDYRDFYDRQWSFASPVFKRDLHERSLPKLSILPFTAVVPIGNQGDFANASLVKIPSSHQDIFQTSSHEVSDTMAID
jgi:hypothetical protein